MLPSYVADLPRYSPARFCLFLCRHNHAATGVPNGTTIATHSHCQLLATKLEARRCQVTLMVIVLLNVRSGVGNSISRCANEFDLVLDRKRSTSGKYPCTCPALARAFSGVAPAARAGCPC